MKSLRKRVFSAALACVLLVSATVSSQGLRKQFISAFTDGFFCIFLYSGRRAVYQVHAVFRTSKYPPNLYILLY